MFHSIVAALFLLVAVPVCAEDKTVTIRGVVDSGTLDSGIYGLEPYCTFPTDSKIANDVFSVCKFLDDCEIHGTINKDNELVSIKSIRKIDTNKEPSVATLTEGAYWSLSALDRFKIGSLSFDEIAIFNLRSVQKDSEKFWEYEFNMTDKRTPTPQELGSGTVRLVKRGDKWHFYR
jgi:hypothetical protein